MTLAPIVLFTYNRPWHTQKTVEALQKNYLAGQSELFIFSDGPKNEQSVEKVSNVRSYINTIDSFKKVTIVEQSKNLGLAYSIIDGVTKIVNEYGKVIVLEDDLITSPFFLRFMNEGLEFYKDIEKVMHISGFMPFIKTDGLPSTFFIKPTSCWSWATWERAWNHFEKDTDKLLKLFTDEMKYDFNIDNSMDYFSHIQLNKQGSINTWAIYWYASVFLSGGLSLHPKDSLTKNIGHDGSGVHCGDSQLNQMELANLYDITFETVIEESKLARQALANYYHPLEAPKWKQLMNKILIMMRRSK